MICGKRSARNIPRLRRSTPPAPCRPFAPALCCSGTLLRQHAAVQPLPSSAAPAPCCSGALALHVLWRSTAPALWCSAAPAPHRSSVSLLRRNSGVLLLKRSVAPALQCSTTAVPCRSDALLLQHSATPLLRHCDAPALRYSVNSRGAGARGWRARSAHQNRVAPPHSNTQATLADMCSTVRRVSQKEISLPVVGVTHAL